MKPMRYVPNEDIGFHFGGSSPGKARGIPISFLNQNGGTGYRKDQYGGTGFRKDQYGGTGFRKDQYGGTGYP